MSTEKRYFFQNEALQWVLGDKVTSIAMAGTYEKFVTDFRTPEGDIVDALGLIHNSRELLDKQPIPITDYLKNANGDAYENLAELESAVADFFFRVGGSGSGSSLSSAGYYSYAIPSEQIDGESLTYTVPFPVPIIQGKRPWIEMDSFMWTLENGIDSIVSASGSATITTTRAIPLDGESNPVKATLWYVPSSVTINPSVSKWKTDNHILELTDASCRILMNSSDPKTITVPPDADVDFDLDALIEGIRFGAGTVTWAAGAGVTIHSIGGALAISDQYGATSITKVGDNEWLLIGAIS